MLRPPGALGRGLLMLNHTNSFVRGIIEWVILLAIAFGVSLFIRTYVASPYVVPTGSMENTIEVGDQVFAQKVTLELGQGVKAGDIVVFKNPDGTSSHDLLVKRVIAVGGQTVDLKDGRVYVDGQPLTEPYTIGTSAPLATQQPGVQVSFPYKVPEGSVWMMGDNRENSADSRYFGAVPNENLVAVVMIRFWPLNRLGTL